MNRRQFLAAVAGTGALAGCHGIAGDARTGGQHTTDGSETSADGASTTGTSGSATPGSYDSSIAAQGVPTTICSEPIQTQPGIYAIDEPAVASDWTGVDIPRQYRRATSDGDLAADHTVVGIEADGRARAYPLVVLSIHEIVNDDFGGPILVTYCPICQSGMVAARVVDGTATTFAVSGLLWQPERIRVAAAQQDNRTFGARSSGGERVDVRASGNLVMYDLATGSYWSQILARGICGPETGTSLSIRPATLSTWGEWQTAHPDTDVVLPAPRSGTYFPETYAGQTPAPASE